MPTTRDVQAKQRAEAGWAFDPDQVQVEQPTQLSPNSSAAQLAARIHDHRQTVAEERDEVLDRLQAKRKRQLAERARTAGLTTAEILAARRLRTG
jgi:hypothetical protein